MKNTIIKSSTVSLALLVFGIASYAQAPKRIDFSKSTSLVWEENVAATSTKSFVFRATKGQKLKLSMVDDTDAGSMDLGKISIEPNTDAFEMDIEVTKDYQLTVSNNTRKPTSFRIMICLEDPEIETEFNPNGPNVVKVKFEKGETSAAITKDIPSNGSLDFLIGARKGQALGFQIGYEGRASDIKAFLTEPGLQDVSAQTGAEARKEFKVKKTGDHRVTVNNMASKEVTMTIYFDIY